MPITWFVIGFALGALLGAGIALAVCLARAKADRRQMRDTFSALAAEALDANSQRLASQAASALDGRKELIDQAVQATNQRLDAVRTYLQQLEAQRRQDFGRLSESVTSLSSTTGELRSLLASSHRRGAWGERMAEDVLRLAGLAEGVNYAKQSADDAAQGRPDFTFYLPNDLKVNMDVKFPLDRYKNYLDAETDDARAEQLKALVTAVRGHIRAVASRGYVDVAGGTVPYVLLFIPSEQIYSLVLSADAELMDEALDKSVVLCGPMTLYAMLSVVRQAAENANLMKTADEVLSLLGEFSSQWQNYNTEMDKLGDRLDQVRKQYDYLRTTRTNVLERPLRKIEDLRADSGMEDAQGP